MRPSPALALAALCLLALPTTAAAAAYFGSVPVASPRSACPIPDSGPCEASNSAFCPGGTLNTFQAHFAPGFSVSGSLSSDFTSLSRVQVSVPCPARFLCLVAVRL